jgi:hypothetical protein
MSKLHVLMACAPEIQKQINTWILTVKKIIEKIIYHKNK